jgi:type II secretory pathway component PulL
MKLSEWLDKKEAEGLDVSQIVLPDDLAYNEDPDETIY